MVFLFLFDVFGFIFCVFGGDGIFAIAVVAVVFVLGFAGDYFDDVHGKTNILNYRSEGMINIKI